MFSVFFAYSNKILTFEKLKKRKTKEKKNGCSYK
jgi:hypothetical protein